MEREKELLIKLYVEEGKSLREIAELFSVTKMTVRSRLIKYDIPLRRRGVKQKTFRI